MSVYRTEMDEYRQRIRLAKIILGGASDSEQRESACADLRAVAREADGTAAAREALEALELCHVSPYPSYSDPEVRRLRQEWSALMGLTDSRLPDLLEKLKATPALAICMHQDVLGKLRAWIRVALDNTSEVLEPKNLPALDKVVELISGIDVYNVVLEELKPLRGAVFRLRYQETSRRIEEALGEWHIQDAWDLWEALGTPPKGLEDDVKGLQKKIYGASAVRKKVKALLCRTPAEPPASWEAVGELVTHTQELYTHGRSYPIPELRRQELASELQNGLAAISHFVETRAALALSFGDLREFWEEFEGLPRTRAHRGIEPQLTWFHTFLNNMEETAKRESASAPDLEALERYATELKGQRAGLPDFIVARVDSLLGHIAQVAAAWRAMSSGQKFAEPAELPLPAPANMESEAPVYRAYLDSLREASAKLSSGLPVSEELYRDIIRVAEGVLRERPGHALAVELKDEAERGLTAYHVERAVEHWDINGLIRLSRANPGTRAYDYYTQNEDVLRTWFSDVSTRPVLEDYDKAARGWMNWKFGVSKLAPGRPGALAQAIAREEEKRRGEWYTLLSGLLDRGLSHDVCKDIARSLEEHTEDATLAALRQNFLRKADVAKAHEYIDARRWDDARDIINSLDEAHPDTRRLNTYYAVDRAKSKGIEALSLVLESEWHNVRRHLDKPLELLLEAVDEAWERAWVQGLTKTLDRLRNVVTWALGKEEAAEPKAAAKLKEWEEWFDIEQAVLDGESAASLKSLVAYLRGNRVAEPPSNRLKSLLLHWDADNNLVMLAWATSAFGAVGLEYDPLERLTAESEEVAAGVFETLRTKAELPPVILEKMLRDISRQEAGWKKLNDYLRLTGESGPYPGPPEGFRTAVEQTYELQRIMTDLDVLAHSDLREPALQDRVETAVSALRRLRNVAARERLLKQATRLQTLTTLDDIGKYIRESARQCRSEAHLYDSDVFSALGQNLRVLVERFKEADALGGHMWDVVSKDYCEEVFRLACIYVACPEPPDLEALAARLDELNRVDKNFIRAVNELWERRPFVSADSPFDPEQHAEYLTRFPDDAPPFRRAYLYFERRLAGVATLRSIIEQSRHKLPEWVARYLDEGIPSCAERP